MELCEVQQLASVADRFQIKEVEFFLEESMLSQLSVEHCWELLTWSGGRGMLRLEADALKMAACRFEEFARMAEFMRLGEEALSILMDDDRLTGCEERGGCVGGCGGVEGGYGG